jgi:uncharacterized membrane protein
VDQKEYQSMIGSLLYLTMWRPDIQFFFVYVRSFSVVAEGFTSAGRQADLHVSSIHSWARSLVLGVLFPYAS